MQIDQRRAAAGITLLLMAWSTACMLGDQAIVGSPEWFEAQRGAAPTIDWDSAEQTLEGHGHERSCYTAASELWNPIECLLSEEEEAQLEGLPTVRFDAVDAPECRAAYSVRFAPWRTIGLAWILDSPTDYQAQALTLAFQAVQADLDDTVGRTISAPPSEFCFGVHEEGDTLLIEMSDTLPWPKDMLMLDRSAFVTMSRNPLAVQTVRAPANVERKWDPILGSRPE